MSILEVQATAMEAPTPDLVEPYVPLDVPAVRLAPSPVPEDGDIPPGTAGRAAALGL